MTMELIYNLVLTGGIGILAWAFKEFYSQSKERDGRAFKNIADIDGKVGKLEEKLSEKYVLKEDFYREMNKIDMKLDSMREDISEMMKALSGVTAQVTEILKKMT